MTINEAFDQLGKYLNNGQFDAVLQLCKNIIEAGYNYSEIYQTMLLAEVQVSNMEELQNVKSPLDIYDSYKEAFELSDQDMKEYLEHCNNEAKKRAKDIQQMNISFLKRPESFGTGADNSEKVSIFSIENDDVKELESIHKVSDGLYSVIAKLITNYHSKDYNATDIENCKKILNWGSSQYAMFESAIPNDPRPDRYVGAVYKRMLENRVSGSYSCKENKGECELCGEETENPIFCDKCLSSLVEYDLIGGVIGSYVSLELNGRKFDSVFWGNIRQDEFLEQLTQEHYKKLQDVVSQFDIPIDKEPNLVYSDDIFFDITFMYDDEIIKIGQFRDGYEFRINMNTDTVYIEDDYETGGINIYTSRLNLEHTTVPVKYDAFILKYNEAYKAGRVHKIYKMTQIPNDFSHNSFFANGEDTCLSIWVEKQTRSEKYRSMWLNDGTCSDSYSQQDIKTTICKHELYTTQIINEKENTGGYSFGKGLAGAALFGPVGAVAGIGGQTKKKQYLLNTCKQCGYQWRQY